MPPATLSMLRSLPAFRAVALCLGALLLAGSACAAQADLVSLIDAAGRQRMLSQRLAKLYMLRAYGVDTASIRDDLDSASREFEAALASLRAAPENTPAIAV